MDAKQAFTLFSDLASEARVNHGKRREMGEQLMVAIKLADKTKKDLLSLASRITIDRWLSGRIVPPVLQVERLKEFLIPEDVTSDKSVILTDCLLDPRYRPVISFLFQQEDNKQPLSKEQVQDLLDLAERSKGLLTVEFIQVFLGIE